MRWIRKGKGEWICMDRWSGCVHAASSAFVIREAIYLFNLAACYYDCLGCYGALDEATRERMIYCQYMVVKLTNESSVFSAAVHAKRMVSAAPGPHLTGGGGGVGGGGGGSRAS